MDDKKFTKDTLNVLGIFQLRDLARSVGVHLPTTYKKDDLIEKILQVANGETMPFVPKNKKGRPPKNLVDVNRDFSQFAQQSQNKTAKFSWLLGELVPVANGLNFVDELKVCMPDAVFYYKEENKPKEEIGIVFVEPSGAGAFHIGGLNKLSLNDIAYIACDVIRAYNIKTGDELKCNVYVNLENEKVVNEIFEINGKKLNEFKRSYDAESSFDSINPVEQIIFDDASLDFLNKAAPIGKGQRVCVRAEKMQICSQFLSKVASNACKKNIKTIVIAIDKRPEEKSLYSGDGIEYLFCNFDVMPFRQMYMVNLGIERAKRLCEMGFDVVLCVDNMLSALRAYDCFYEKSDNSGYSMEAQIAVKKIFATGGNVLNAGTITLFAGVCEGDMDANKFFDSVEIFCNSHIYLSKDENNDFSILQKSYTENDKKLLK